MDKFYIGIGGFARSGKDLCGKIIIDVLSKNRYTPKRFALADELKKDVEEFLTTKCNVSCYTDNSELKADIRPFLVWYGCYQRKRFPNYWIDKIKNNIALPENRQVDVVICTDIRFENEAEWIKQTGGWLIHVSKFDIINNYKILQLPPNDEERISDPAVKKHSDRRIEWENISNDGVVIVDTNRLVNNTYLRQQVLNSLQSCGLKLPNPT